MKIWHLLIFGILAFLAYRFWQERATMTSPGSNSTALDSGPVYSDIYAGHTTNVTKVTSNAIPASGLSKFAYNIIHLGGK